MKVAGSVNDLVRHGVPAALGLEVPYTAFSCDAEICLSGFSPDSWERVSWPITDAIWRSINVAARRGDP